MQIATLQIKHKAARLDQKIRLIQETNRQIFDHAFVLVSAATAPTACSSRNTSMLRCEFDAELPHEALRRTPCGLTTSYAGLPELIYCSNNPNRGAALERARLELSDIESQLRVRGLLE